MNVAIYCRLSEEDHNKTFQLEDSISIQNQKSMLIQHAIKNSWEIFSIYSDDDYSGADRNRPEFNRLIRDAKAKKFNIVLCKSQSRFTRELELVEEYLHTLFPTLGIRFVSLADNADTNDRSNKKSRQINGLVNEWYLEEMSENIKSVLTSRREQGFHIGAFAPYGYQKDPITKGHLLIDPEAATIVREIFSLYLNGNGKQVIARTLNERRIPNPTEYKRLHGQFRNKHAANSGLWTYFTISNILTNEVYIGNMVQGKTGVDSYKTQKKVTYPQEQWIIVKNTHDPIINQNVWNQVQALIERKTTSSSKRGEGIFARKVRCISCGYRMHSVKNREKRGFKCARHALSHDACIGGYISFRKLERTLLAQIHIMSHELLDEELLEDGIDPFPEQLHWKAEMETEIAALKRKIENNQSVVKELYIRKLRGQITESDYLSTMQGIREDKSASESRMDTLNKQIEEIGITAACKYNKKDLIHQYVGCQKLTKEMVNILIDYIEVGKKDPVTKFTSVVIHWNF